jgi:hypothetical protein
VENGDFAGFALVMRGGGRVATPIQPAELFGLAHNAPRLRREPGLPARQICGNDILVTAGPNECPHQSQL